MGMSVEQSRLELYELKEELQKYGAASADCLCPESILLLLPRRSSYGGDEAFLSLREVRLHYRSQVDRHAGRSDA